MIQVGGNGVVVHNDRKGVVRVAGRDVANHDLIVRLVSEHQGSVRREASDK